MLLGAHEPRGCRYEILRSCVVELRRRKLITLDNGGTLWSWKALQTMEYAPCRPHPHAPTEPYCPLVLCDVVDRHHCLLTSGGVPSQSKRSRRISRVAVASGNGSKSRKVVRSNASQAPTTCARVLQQKAARGRDQPCRLYRGPVRCHHRSLSVLRLSFPSHYKCHLHVARATILVECGMLECVQ